MDYAQQQLMIRQELTDANRQRRPPDPTTVPVTPRTPNKQAPRVAVAVSSKSDDDAEDSIAMDEDGAVVGPFLVKKEESDTKIEKSEGPSKDANFDLQFTGAGGAWGAGAAPGSVLARLIEEQEAKEDMEETGNDDSAGDTQMYRAKEVASDNYYGQPTLEGGNQEHRDWNQHEDWGNHNNPNHQDWNNHHGNQDWGYQNHGQPDWSHRGHRGGRNPSFGGRGGGRGGRGFNVHGRGRGRGFPPPPPPPPNNPHWGGRGDFGDVQGRKRGREPYDNRRRR